MAGDNLFKVITEVFVERHRRVALFRLAKDIAYGATAPTRSTNDGHRSVIFLLDNHLAALPIYL